MFALPDGETGPRAAWVGYEREQLARPNPDVAVVQETESPIGRPRHAYATPVFGIRDGVTEVHFDSFQIGLPFPSSALNAFKADFAADYPVADAPLRTSSPASWPG